MIFIEISLDAEKTDLQLISLDTIANIKPEKTNQVTITFRDGTTILPYYTYDQIKRLIGTKSYISDLNGAPL